MMMRWMLSNYPQNFHFCLTFVSLCLSAFKLEEYFHIPFCLGSVALNSAFLLFGSLKDWI